MRTQTTGVGDSDGVGGVVTERHRHGGRIVRADGSPVADAWVNLPDAGAWAATDADGRFRLGAVPAGTHRLVARTPAGEQLAETISVPGSHSDLVIPS